MYRAILHYRGGEGVEITTFTSLLSESDTIWLIPPSERVNAIRKGKQYQAPYPSSSYHCYRVVHRSHINGISRIHVQRVEPDTERYDLGYLYNEVEDQALEDYGYAHQVH